MAGRTVELRVGGQLYRVVSTASEPELARLAAIVNEKLAHVGGSGRPVTPQMLVLAALALAHDLEEERGRTAALLARSRDAFGRILARVDAVLGADQAATPPGSADRSG